MRDQILSFLSQGFSKADVIKTVGCPEPLYDEIVKDSTFVSDLSSKRQELLQERIEKRYNKLEDEALKQIQNQIDVMDPNQLCRVLDTIAKNKVAYRRPANTYQNPTVHQSVTLILPQAALNQNVVLDSNSQVVAIGEKTMSPLPLQGVKELFAKLDANKLKELEDDLAIPNANAA